MIMNLLTTIKRIKILKTSYKKGNYCPHNRSPSQGNLKDWTAYRYCMACPWSFWAETFLRLILTYVCIRIKSSLLNSWSQLTNVVNANFSSPTRHILPKGIRKWKKLLHLGLRRLSNISTAITPKKTYSLNPSLMRKSHCTYFLKTRTMRLSLLIRSVLNVW